MATAQYQFFIDGKLKQVETDSLMAEVTTIKLGNELLLKGYLNYTLEQKKKTTNFYTGKKYVFDKITMDTAVKNILAASGYKLHLLKNSPANALTISKASNQVLSYLENNGYINATLLLKDTQFKDHKISTKLEIDKGEQVLYDSLLVVNKNKISTAFLHRYLGIHFKEPFNAAKFKKIKKKINNLSFLSMKDDPEINLINNRAEIVLNMKDQKASRFDFIIGILPKTETGKTTYKVIGEFTTDMKNFFGYGEAFYAHIQRLQADNQSLELRASYPYLFNTPLITEGNFKLYRNGGDFIELKANIGANYAINDHTSIGGFIDYNSSRLIEIDSTSLVTTKKLPSQLDVSLSGIDLKVRSNNVDYILNPSKGYNAKFSIPLSRKRIIRNRTIETLSTPEYDFVQAYDTLQLNSIQIRPQLEIEYYQPITNRFILKLGSKNGYIFNNYKVYKNEYFRLGGHQFLRGFDELSINAQGFSILQAEVRLILNQNSFISLPFIDSGWLYRADEDLEHALGVGMGMNFGTSVGMFNISFAAGRRRNIPFNFNNVKVHFGYVSVF